MSTYRPAFEDALRLLILHADADADIEYTESRIRYESAGNYGVADLKI
jgi:hypothetical protein